MTSKKLFNIAGVFLIIFIATYFAELYGISFWYNRIAALLLAIFAVLGFIEKKKEEKLEQ